jgi:WD40 repeat protein
MLSKIYCSYFLIVLLLFGCDSAQKPDDRLEAASSGINGGTISNDGRLAIIGSVHHGGSLWRLNDGERIYNWNHSEDELSIILSADIAPDNQWALTAEAHTMVLWDTKSGQAARFWTTPAEVLDADLAQGGRYAILGQADHSAVIFNTVKGGIARSFDHEGRVRSVDLSTDGRLAITGSEDQTAVVWRVDNGEKILTAQYQEDVQQVAISPNGHYAFAAAKYDRAEILDIRSGKSLKSIPLSKEKIKRGLEITAARFSEDGQQLLLGYTNRKVELWQVESVELVKTWRLSKRHTWQPTSASVIDIAFNEKANRYHAIGSNGFIYVLK